jgi:DNA-binding transcriptional MerR regulator
MNKPLTQTSFGFVELDDKPEPVKPVVAAPVVKERPKPAPALVATPAKKPVSTRGRKSLKDISLAADLLNVPDDEVLFQKQYYSIGEVAQMFRENQSLIRYWETEFDILQPRKNRKGDRFFRPVDIKNLVLIYDLLRRRKFTIEGAKDFLKKNRNADEKFEMIRSLEKIKAFLLELKASL